MRVSTGVDGVDELLQGGLPTDRLYVVSGPPGSGKTTFASHFIAQGAREGDRALFMSMHETESELVADMSSYRSSIGDALQSDSVLFVNATDNNGHFRVSQMLNGNSSAGPENLGSKIRGFVESQGIDRVVIDSVMVLEYLFGEHDVNVMKLLMTLKKTAATIVLISEMKDPSAYTDAHYLAHGVLFFHNYLDSDGMQRGIQVVKMRGTDIDTDIFEIEFGRRGLSVNTGVPVAY